MFSYNYKILRIVQKIKHIIFTIYDMALLIIIIILFNIYIYIY